MVKTLEVFLSKKLWHNRFSLQFRKKDTKFKILSGFFNNNKKIKIKIKEKHIQISHSEGKFFFPASQVSLFSCSGKFTSLAAVTGFTNIQLHTCSVDAQGFIFRGPQLKPIKRTLPSVSLQVAHLLKKKTKQNKLLLKIGLKVR